MYKSGVYVSNDDIELLMNKFDKDLDGKIGYQEFRDELLPKLNFS
jgi:Ca2+-binding EF-hand superfamily protein